jgi:small basic protein (TIGR04137 family)
MSIHSSLRSGGKGRKHRSVLKRHERLKVLKEKSLWGEDKSVLGLPKVKMQRIKVRKEKSTAETAAEGVAAGKPTEAAAAPAPAAPAKGGKPEKK